MITCTSYLPTQPPQLHHVHCHSSLLWHYWLGHPASPILNHALRSSQIPVQASATRCLDCPANKSHKIPFNKSTLSSSCPLQVVFSDVWGPTSVTSINGHSYYVIFIDLFSKYVWLYPIKFKSYVSTIFPIFKSLVENQLNTKIKTLYTDNGGEDIKLRSFLQHHGITHLTTPPHTPEHNGLSERKHRHLLETARCLLHHASLPLHLWSYALQTAAYLINRMPTRRLHMKSPLQVLFGCVPNYIKLRIFGCLCFAWLTPYTPNKLVPKSKLCVFLGYSPTQSAYYCLDPQPSKIFTSRHVQFVEDIFPYSSPLTSSAPHDSTSNLNLLQSPQQPAPLIPSQPLAITHPIQQPPSSPNILSSSFNQAPVLDPSPSSNLSPSSSPISPYVPSPHPSSTPATSINEYTLSSPLASVDPPPPCSSAPKSTHPMTTRSKNGIFKPKQVHTVTKFPLPSHVEPTCFSQAIKHPEWKVAMS
uniref:Retrovirus-related Pol polyprotein from transposon TNT 1-94 n=1 Tax=Cajanus cajan TaxID=3821 RepID=A0A151QTP0_CAJCA|nr:Retrovirus-related Pol polyprotein from transposon TNT 1-94 [Cajanus cajan]